MRENLLASWRQSGQKQDPCPSLLNHNANYKRLLPPCCDFANGVRAFVKDPKPSSSGLLLGYARVSKGDEQNNTLQAKALRAAAL